MFLITIIITVLLTQSKQRFLFDWDLQIETKVFHLFENASRIVFLTADINCQKSIRYSRNPERAQLCSRRTIAYTNTFSTLIVFETVLVIVTERVEWMRRNSRITAISRILAEQGP